MNEHVPSFWKIFKEMISDTWGSIKWHFRPNPLAGLTQEEIYRVQAGARAGAVGGGIPSGKIIIPDARGMAELRAGKTIGEITKEPPNEESKSTS